MWSINEVVKLMSLFFLGKKMTGDHLLYYQQKSDCHDKVVV